MCVVCDLATWQPSIGPHRKPFFLSSPFFIYWLYRFRRQLAVFVTTAASIPISTTASMHASTSSATITTSRWLQLRCRETQGQPEQYTQQQIVPEKNNNQIVALNLASCRPRQQQQQLVVHYAPTLRATTMVITTKQALSLYKTVPRCKRDVSEWPETNRTIYSKTICKSNWSGTKCRRTHWTR